MATCSATSECQVNPKSCLVIISVLLDTEIIYTCYVHDDIIGFKYCRTAEK